MNTTESSLNRSRRRANSCSSIEVLDRARGKGCGTALLVGRELLAQPGHGTVEVVQGQPVHAGDVIVGHPLLAGPVRAGDHDPVQHGGEDGPLDRKLEPALSEQILDHGPAAGLLPQPPEQQRRADALAGKPLGVAGLDLREDHGPLGVAGDRAGQALEGAGGGDGLLAAEVLDDALLGAAVLAHGLDEIEVGVAVDALLADEHAKLAADLAIVRQGKTTRLLQNLASQLFAVAVPA